MSDTKTKHELAWAKYDFARKAYRAGEIDDDEFLDARQTYEAAGKEYDDCEG